jgi:hypothetical protein
MRYRPQYAYPKAPRGYKDQDFAYYFSSVGNPALGQNIAAGALITNIPLQLDRDIYLDEPVPFLWRATKVLTNQTGLGIQLSGPDGTLLNNNHGAAFLSYFPSGDLIAGFAPVPNEPEIECPLGAVILVNLKNLSTVGIVSPITEIWLMGVKRWKVAA